MITIIDYGLGNLASVANALEKLEIPYLISSSPFVLKKSKALILPGDGAAGQGMENLKKLNLDKVIIEEVRNGKPIFGICLGMQLFLSFSEEGNVKCLGLIKGKVKKLRIKLKIPLIGWDNVRIMNQEAPLRQGFGGQARIMNNVPDNGYFYFINSFVCVPDDKSIITGVTDYEKSFCSVLEKDNIFGAQFHPEKSGDAGLQMLKNFYSLSSSGLTRGSRKQPGFPLSRE